MKKHIFFILLFLNLVATAQQYDFVPKEYHLMTREENKILFDKPLTIIKCFSEDGIVLNKKQSNKYFANSQFQQVMFVSDEKIIIVFQKLSNEEEKRNNDYIKNHKETLKALINKPAPIFDIEDIEGNLLKLNELKGKVVVLNFWHTRCAPCIEEMPGLNKIRNDFYKKEVVFISFTYDDKAKVDKFMENHKLSYKVVPDARVVIRSYSINSFPTNIIIDKEGKVSFIEIGYTSSTAKKINSKIKSLIDN